VSDNSLETTRRFWNASPCGGQDTFQERFEHRYTLEPWVLDLLHTIAPHQKHIVEVGCGQGTDGIVLCSLLPAGGSYLGLDYSDASVSAALDAAQEAKAMLTLRVEPRFRTANAEVIDLPDGSVQCVYSNGVLHHTPDPPRAFAEIWRVLAPGGEAFITLYRKPSLKLCVAKALRALQRAADRLTGADRCAYRLISGRTMPRFLGTMLLEAFGVPVMEWYSRADITGAFGRFTILGTQPVGCNIPRQKPRSRGWHRWGYLWLVHLRKPLL
jgi:ubiquinone/menaquinone biosynthesis C-methylase UbiE